MEKTLTVLHSIPGRIRLHIPLLANRKEFNVIEELLSSITGIEKVKIEGITRSMLIYYDTSQIKVRDVLRYVSLFFVLIEEGKEQQNKFDKSADQGAISAILSAWYRLVVSVEKNINAHVKIFNCGKIVYKILAGPIRKKEK